MDTNKVGGIFKWVAIIQFDTKPEVGRRKVDNCNTCSNPVHYIMT